MHFRPHQPTNAIVLATFACEFSPPLGDTKLKQIEELHSKIAEGLPQKIVQPAVSFRVVQGSQQPTPIQTIGAVAFSSYERDGTMARQFNAVPLLISFNEFKYDGWETVWPAAREILHSALDAVGDANISAFGLEYQDRFSAEPEAAGPLDVSLVLSKGSQYLAPRVFGLKDVWHLQEGSVEERSDPCPHSCNDNINVGLVRRRELPPPRLAIEITLQHRRVLKRPVSIREARQWMEPFFTDMHTSDKKVMRDLLVPEMSKRIGIDK